MDVKKINKLVAISYNGNKLDVKKINKIISFINKSDLKKYINCLKLTEKKRSIVVSSPIDNQDVRKFEKLFPHKKIIFKKNPSLMLGVQIVDDDLVYNFTLKNSLDKIINYIEQNYD